MIKNKSLLKFVIIFSLVLLIFCLYVAVSFYIPPGIYADSGHGFLVLKSMESGSPFNFGRYPNFRDISRDQLGFLTWWSPGQYAVPGAIKHLFNLKLGQAIIFTVILFSALGLLGYYKLYRLLGFEAILSLSAILIIVLQRYFSLSFTIYNGGEILIFGGAPWVIFFALQKQRMNFISLVLLVILSLAGFFLKSSFLISFFAILLMLVIIQIYNLKGLKSLNRNILKDVLIYTSKMLGVALVVIFCVYKCFLSRGNFPGLDTSLNFNLDNIFIPVGASILSSFPIDDLLSRFFSFPGYKYTFNFDYSLFHFVAVFMGCFVMIKLVREKTLKATYKITLISFFIVFLAIFIVFYLKGSTISYEWRHFRPAGLLFLPGMLYVIYRKKNLRVSKLIFSIFLVFMCFYGLFGFFNRKVYFKDKLVTSNQAFVYGIDKEALIILRQLDESLTFGNNLFYVTSPEIALDIRNNRWMVIHADFISVDELKSKSYFGVTDNLFLFLQKSLKINGKEEAIIGSFKDYKGFEVIYETVGYRILKGVK